MAGDGQPVAVREDSSLDVPEPEVALVLNRFGDIVGYTACNDISSRSIESENPLYLPQAKIYLGSCALGPAITPAHEIADPYDLSIEMTILRGGEVVWQGTTSTSKLHRRFEELAGYLFRADQHPEGVVLSTGTCLVPEAPFGLVDGDVVKVTVERVGTLTKVARRNNSVNLGLASTMVRWSMQGQLHAGSWRWRRTWTSANAACCWAGDFGSSGRPLRLPPASKRAGRPRSGRPLRNGGA